MVINKMRKGFWMNGKNQRCPITSHGLILYTVTPEKNVLFLLYQRRDNFEYIDFLRGLWSHENQIPLMFSSMSEEERLRIRYYTFEELWDDLWVDHTTKVYNEGFIRSKNKFESIKHRIPEILDTTYSQVKGTNWGFPKGKKDYYNETSIDCAIREFKEETNLEVSPDNIISTKPYVENFRGSNNKYYSTCYYLAKLKEPVYPGKYATPQCIRKDTLSDEASEVMWFTFEEVCARLNPKRQSIARKVFEYIQNNDLDYNT